MTLTREERKRLAEEMRGLAMECIDNGPEMENLWCGCAIGISLKRAGLWDDEPNPATDDLDGEALAEQVDQLLVDPTAPDACDSHGGGTYGVVSLAVQERIWKSNPTAVVFPLLALADALDESTP